MEPFSTYVNHACLACPSCLISLGGHIYKLLVARRFASGTCDIVGVTIGSSSSNTKSVTPPEPVVSCTTPCDKDCWLNAQAYPDEFQLTVLDNGQVQAKRLDTSWGWGMDLKVPCCKSMAIFRVGCGSGCIGCCEGLRRDVGIV